MKLKKMLVFAIAVATIFSLAACGSSEPSPAGSANTEAQAAEDQVEEEAESKPADADFQQVLVDDETVKVEITGVEHSGFWGYTWKVSIENKTDDTTLMIAMENVSVNGVMSDPLFATEVAPGKSSNNEVSWFEEDFEKNGIEEVNTVEFDLKVYDSEDWLADSFVDERMVVYPLGEEAAGDVARESAETDMVLVDNDQCSMIIKSVDPDNMWGYTLNVYLENRTDKDLMFAVEDASVNDIMCDPFWATTVAAGKTSHSEISWSETSFEENEITDVITIDLPIHIYDEEDFETVIEETFTIDPSELTEE